MAAVTTYLVELFPSGEGFAVSCPGLPGCWSQGQTEEDALENTQDAIREYLLTVAELEPEGVRRWVEVTI
ncbi:MAG: type II toxin-antitoxin system HicB family antitoxin [Dehalococcoidia bacterium]